MAQTQQLRPKTPVEPPVTDGEGEVKGTGTNGEETPEINKDEKKG